MSNTKRGENREIEMKKKKYLVFLMDDNNPNFTIQQLNIKTETRSE